MKTGDERLTSMLLAEIVAGDPHWWYLSFAGDEGWRGAVVVRANGLAHATTIAHRHGLNPGGEVKGWRLTFAADPPAGMLGRIIVDKEELDTLGEQWCDAEERATS